MFVRRTCLDKVFVVGEPKYERHVGKSAGRRTLDRLTGKSTSASIKKVQRRLKLLIYACVSTSMSVNQIWGVVGLQLKVTIAEKFNCDPGIGVQRKARYWSASRKLDEG